MLDIVFYKFNGKRNELEKTLTDRYDTRISLYTEFDLKNPFLNIIGNKNFVEYNYCYLPEYKKYYFVTNKGKDKNGTFNLKLEEDVLMTFKNLIRDELIGVVDRATIYNTQNAYIEDDDVKLPIYVNQQYIKAKPVFKPEEINSPYFSQNGKAPIIISVVA